VKNFNDCTKKEQVARWENVLRVLRALTPHQRRKHWDMQTIGEKTDCGTVACAAGHSSLDPWFRRRGYAGHYEEKHYSDRVIFELITPDADAFFGEDGSSSIFFNTDIRPVGQVIREVKAWIKVLSAKRVKQ
jgi:hypothetical protein